MKEVRVHNVDVAECIHQYTVPIFDLLHAQVGTLDVAPRLLERWQARREARLRGGRKSRTSSARLVVYTLAAMVAAFVHWLCVSGERAAHRTRAFVACVFLATSMLLASSLV